MSISDKNTCPSCQKLSWCVHWRGSDHTRPTCGSAVGAGSVTGFLHKSFHTLPVRDLIQGHRDERLCSDSPSRRPKSPRIELKRPLRAAPLFQSCRKTKHAAAHTLSHWQVLRVPSLFSNTPGGHPVAGSALWYTHLLPPFSLHQFPLRSRSK